MTQKPGLNRVFAYCGDAGVFLKKHPSTPKTFNGEKTPFFRRYNPSHPLRKTEFSAINVFEDR